MYHSVKHNTTLRTSLRNSKLIKFIFVKFKMFFRYKCQLKFHIIFRNIKIHMWDTHQKFICCSMTMEGDAKGFQVAIQAQSISCHDVVYMCQCVLKLNIVSSLSNVSQLECYHNRYIINRKDTISMLYSMSIHGESVILKRGVPKKLINKPNRKQSGQNSFLFINRC